MLTQTFYHLPGSNSLLEKALWRQGCKDWFDFLKRPDYFDIGSLKYDHWLNPLQETLKAYHEKNAHYFELILSSQNTWRAWEYFKDSCVYLDIETNGGRGEGSTTIVGLYDGDEFNCLVKGKNLHHLPEIISQYKMMITFHGRAFDIPVLRNEFPGISFPGIHLDLCPTLKQLGFKGGLKKIEDQLGIVRAEPTQGMTGFDAVRLWRLYQRTDNKEALEMLIAYNKEDVVNLKSLAEYSYHRLACLLGGAIN